MQNKLIKTLANYKKDNPKYKDYYIAPTSSIKDREGTDAYYNFSGFLNAILDEWKNLKNKNVIKRIKSLKRQSNFLKEKIAKIKKENPHFVKSSLYEREGYDSVEKFINDAKHILNENKIK